MHQRRSQAASEAGSRAQSEAPSRSQSVTASGMSATLKGLFGGASSRLLGSIMGRSSGHSSKSDQSSEEAEELWFTSLDDFKPICHMLHRGRYMAAYFACANKTGQHFLLKKFDKRGFLDDFPVGAAAHMLVVTSGSQVRSTRGASLLSVHAAHSAS